ncbi:uncharacterized protein LOC131626046 [Vicia villosa]|uniref:uncharacterized protein LOC131626046 n=1 Tax=Vicia villosa TaxID=3911 RepID=UPI00273C2A6F|nr:uncharacterized protein LOC131626046 [Vicia villosa]
MIIGTFNIRGGGSLIKRKRISKIIREGRADVFLIQESKLETVSPSLINSIWSCDSVGWSSIDSEGRSGGIITLWNTNTVEVILSFKGKGFLGIKVKWRDYTFYIVNIYSPCSLPLKKKLWRDLLEAKAKFSDGEWCLAGDFNSVSNSRERKGNCHLIRRSEMTGFSGFIEDCNLIDVPTKGKRFSWYGGKGGAMSRLDRFLVSENLIASLKIVGQWIGDRNISDHCPIWLMIDDSNWGPKPNRVNNDWFENKDFFSFVESEWKNINIVGRGDYVIKEKLRLLKSMLMVWNKEVFGKRDLEIEEDIRAINEADKLLESCREEASEEILAIRSEATSRMWKDIRVKENLIFQKSRSKWENEGDINSRYFHSLLKERRRRNFIGGLPTPSGIAHSVLDVKAEVLSFFTAAFKEEEDQRPVPEGLLFNSLSPEESSSLELPFSETEIKDAVWACNSSKSPGTGRIQFLFHQEVLDFLER